MKLWSTQPLPPRFTFKHQEDNTNECHRRNKRKSSPRPLNPNRIREINRIETKRKSKSLPPKIIQAADLPGLGFIAVAAIRVADGRDQLQAKA